MTESRSSRLGAAFEMILMSSERRKVPAILGVAIEVDASGASFWNCQRCAVPAMRKQRLCARLPMFGWLKRIFSRPDFAGARGEAGERGFAVVVRNGRSPRDRRAELDLVCRDGEALV